ncbi:variant erythrocyte surface antigen-1 family protein [Babesia caballi]|uniref:Variant erythrocyte surface antigen-1 family protein n=1 Tax=Babesia caballi TaxID=5871 RepID=A0AAV4LW76_BABCB|nr:variant erythrocyte surface antigen-1 family protein [Babesia caballi]
MAPHLVPPWRVLQHASVASPRDSPSHLKEAIDWILRVTGKDGQGGGDKGGTEGLQKAVNDLISTAGVTERNPEITITKDILDNLATGLAKFIGYKEHNNNGFIGVDGIAVSNDPLERLRDGMLGFLAGVLGELKRYNESLSLKMDESRVSMVINGIKAALGGGLSKFDAAVKGAAEALGNDQSSSINEVLKKLKAVGSIQNQRELNSFATPVSQYFKGVLEEVKTKATEAQSEVQTFKTNFESLLTRFQSMEANKPLEVTSGATNGIKNEIGNVNSGSVSLKSKIANVNDSSAYALVEIVIAGTNGFLWQLRRKYRSLYQGSQWRSNGNDPQSCAKIFLSCVPFIWSGLSYLCWRCNLNKSEGGFKDLTLSGGDAKDYMFTMGYNNFHQISGEKRGSEVYKTTTKCFKDFKEGMEKAQQTAKARVLKLRGSSETPTFPEFIHELESKFKEISTSVGSNAQNNAMSLAYLVAKCYFKGVHLTSSQSRGRPSTIREMLYWLAGLPFAPGYESLKGHISGIFRGILGDHETTDPAELRLPVAISGSTSKGDFISPASVATYLLTTACSIPNTLAFLQGRSDASGPLLHSVFSNSMEFKYPASGAALFSELCDYAYALKFHLTFLHQQCKGKYSEGFGWRHCKYGQSVNNGLPNGGSVPAWICAGYNCTNAATCYHNGKTRGSSSCSHNAKTSTCGGSTTPSPVQAFLTDTLKGFRLNSSDSTSTHLDNHPAGSMCHVKMGFTSSDLINAQLMGYYLYHPLNFLCGNPNSPLPQLCDQLTCLSRRTPRTLGDLFGFYWHMVGQLFSDAPIIHDLKTVIKRNPYSVEDFITMFKTKLRSRRSTRASAPEKSGVVKSLESMGQTIPFLYQLFTFDESKFLPDLIFDLTQHCHRRHVGSNGSRVTHTNPSNQPCSNPNDLWSLCQPVSNTGNMSDCKSGTCGGYLQPLTHALGSAFAPTYASSYLSWLLYLADDLQSWFQAMLDEFKNIRCDNCSPKCSCTKGRHGSSNCSCTSIVKCTGALPLLYANGFSFHNAYLLNDTQNKRTCKNFHDQLSAVLAQDENTPLFKLLLTIDDFLYMFRFYFFYNLSSFWIIYVCIVLYIYFLRTDLLHLKSHVHFPSSHGIPPITLLTTGKSPSITKLTYFTTDLI